MPTRVCVAVGECGARLARVGRDRRAPRDAGGDDALGKTQLVEVAVQSVEDDRSVFGGGRAGRSKELWQV